MVDFYKIKNRWKKSHVLITIFILFCDGISLFDWIIGLNLSYNFDTPGPVKLTFTNLDKDTPFPIFIFHISQDAMLIFQWHKKSYYKWYIYSFWFFFNVIRKCNCKSLKYYFVHHLCFDVIVKDNNWYAFSEWN